MIWRGSSLQDEAKPFVEHLDDLRSMVLRSLAAAAVGILAAIPLTPWVLEALKVPVRRIGRDPDEFLRILRIAGGFSLAMRLVFWTGLLLAAPVVVWLLAWFVFPGLTGRERTALRRGGLAALTLFIGGVAVGYFMTLPMALRMMLGVNAWLGEPETPFVDLADFAAFELKLLLGFGLAFQLPVVLLALGGVGLISSAQLREKRRHVVVGIFVLAMMLTPPDPITQVIMALPLVLLYEACIWVMRGMELRRGRGDDAAAPEAGMR